MTDAPDILAELLGGDPEDYSAEEYKHPELEELELVEDNDE